MSNLRLPDSLSINAWTGKAGEATSPVGDQAKNWGTGRPPDRPEFLAVTEADERDFRDPRIGWGLILLDDDNLSEKERAGPAGAPPAIIRLWESRPGSPVFRYRPDGKYGFLRRYYSDNTPTHDLSLLGGRGLGDLKIPYYLLIVGSPTDIPWDLQFFLNGPRMVGRLDLDDDGLENYVDALIDGWPTSQASMERPVVWAVDHGRPDITNLMRRSLIEPIITGLRADDQIHDGLRYFPDDGEASVGRLVATLAESRPALVITSSHGMTGPVTDEQTMAAQLGYLVDEGHELLRPDALLADWSPDGAIWMSQACCSAGGAGINRFKGLLENGSSVDLLLDAVAALGPITAPMPKALLGAKRPLRAFVGQVDPTFNWTLRTVTGQVVTESFVKAVSPSLHLVDPKTIAMAFEHYFKDVGTLFRLWDKHRGDANAMKAGARTMAVDARLTAQDRESLVILGDPTVIPTRLPALDA